MFYLFQTSPPDVPLWVVILCCVITASSTWAVGWLNRKRRSSVRAEDAKLSAEAHSLEIQSIGELLQQLRETRLEIESVARESRARAEENRKQQKFLREEVRWHEELTTLARKAMHAAINEMQRCYIAIALRDAALDGADNGTIKPVPVFEPKEYEDIVNYQKIPLPPHRKEDDVTLS